MKAIISLFISLVVLGESYAQWQQTFGPFGWTSMKLTSGNGYIYCGTQGWKIFRSSDNGMTWESKSKGIWQWDIYELYYSDGRVFAVTAENDIGFLYLSDDNGENWHQLNSTGNTSLITGFAKIGSNLFISTYRNSVFVSTDNGDTWKQTIGLNSPYIDIYDIVAMGNSLFMSAYGGLYRSIDNGSSWQFLPNPNFTIDGISAITAQNNSLIMQYGSTFHIMYKSVDYGNSFFEIGGGVPYVYDFYSDGSNVYASTENGVYRSTNEGLNWANIALEGETVYCARVVDDNIIIGTRELGIFTSTDNGSTWINTGYQTDIYNHALVSVNDILIVGNDGQPGISISQNNGNTFTGYNYLLTSYAQSFVKRGNDIFVGTTPGCLNAVVFLNLLTQG